MSKQVLATRYARAFLKAEKNVHGQVGGSLPAFSAIDSVFELRQFRGMLASAAFTPALKLDLLEYVLEQVAAEELLQRFVKLLVSVGRIELLGDISASYRRLLRLERNEVDVRVDAATELDEQQQGFIAKELRTSLNREPILEVKVDQQLLAGLRIRFEDKVLDLSLKQEVAGLLSAMSR